MTLRRPPVNALQGTGFTEVELSGVPCRMQLPSLELIASRRQPLLTIKKNRGFRSRAAVIVIVNAGWTSNLKSAADKWTQTFHCNHC